MRPDAIGFALEKAYLRLRRHVPERRDRVDLVKSAHAARPRTRWRSLAFSGTGTLLAAAIGGRIRVWETTGEFAEVTAPGLGRGPVTSVAFLSASSGQSLLVSADEGGQLAIWNARDGALVATSPPMGQPIVSVAIDPGVATIVGAGSDGVIWQWALGFVAGQVFTPAIDRAKCVALRPDGQLLAAAAAGADGTIRLWNVADPILPVTTLPGHDGAVRALAFSPDGTLLASAGDDGTIRLWDARDGSAIRILIDRTGVVRSVIFAPDSATLVSVGDDGHPGLPAMVPDAGTTQLLYAFPRRLMTKMTSPEESCAEARATGGN